MRRRTQTVLSSGATGQKVLYVCQHMRPAEEEQMDLNEITYKINGAVFEVMRVLGAGFLEKVYPVK